MPKYPFLLAIICVIFITLALGAILDPSPQDVAPKLTGSAALALAGGSLWVSTKPEHSLGQRRTTMVLSAICAALIPMLWLVR